MYFHLHKYIYLTYFNDEIIVLNLRKDQYLILPEDISEAIYLALNNKFNQEQGNYILVNGKDCLLEYFNEIIKYLQDNDILSTKTYDYPTTRLLRKGKPPAGASNVGWRMLNNDLDTKVPSRVVIEAYYLLIKVYFLLKTSGFYSLVKSIKRKGRDNCINRNSKDFQLLVTVLNKACFYFPVRVKCLEWSAALTFIALRRKWKCNIEIGMQNLPFAAHALVKANDEVIADAQSLPETLPIILSEPFDKGEII